MKKTMLRLVSALCLVLLVSMAFSGCAKDAVAERGLSTDNEQLAKWLAAYEMPDSFVLPEQTDTLKVRSVLMENMDGPVSIDIRWDSADVTVYSELEKRLYAAANKDRTGAEVPVEDCRIIDDDANKIFVSYYSVVDNVYSVQLMWTGAQSDYFDENELHLIIQPCDGFAVVGSSVVNAIRLDDTPTGNAGERVLSHSITVEKGKTYYYLANGMAFTSVSIEGEGYVGSGNLSVYEWRADENGITQIEYFDDNSGSADAWFNADDLNDETDYYIVFTADCDGTFSLILSE